MKIILFILALFTQNPVHNDDPMQDVKIISKTGVCASTLQRKLIKNISASKVVDATIKKIVWVDGLPQDSVTLVFAGLKPGEQRDIDCAGCTFRDFKNVCTYFS